MKIKCDDGKVRTFNACSINEIFGRHDESKCTDCGWGFGVHDTKILKPEWKKHVCGKASAEHCKEESTHISKGIETAYPCEGKVWKDGYCKTHHPDSKKKADHRRRDNWEKKWAAERLGKANVVAGKDYVEARKAAGLLTLKEAKALGAKI